MDLVRIDGAAENDFVRSNIDGDWWIGATDAATEGTWTWTIGGDAFWLGRANGSAVGSLFSRWNLGQPDDLGAADCAQVFPDGKWADDGCTETEEYVCEFAVDDCPLDPNKSAPGECDCGTPDTDTDADGVPDCHDECPSDASKILPGDCGCSDAPAAQGTPCNDGICAANNQCDGAGTCGTANQCAPEPGCTLNRLGLSPYYFCDVGQTFATARQKCLAAGMDLTAIETPEEDAFVTSIIHEHAWMGSTDAQTPGTWTWLGTNQTFWTGGSSGGPVGGAYTNWEHNDPDYGISGDCAAKDPPSGNGLWETFGCSSTKAYTCERIVQVRPIAKCVRRYQFPRGAALFGYENPAGTTVTIPHGSSNSLDPDAGVEPPQEFEPGLHDRLFWVPFDLTGSVAWHLNGQDAVADASSPGCELGDVPPVDQPDPAPDTVRIDAPSIPFDSVSSRIVPDVTTSARSHLPGPVFGTTMLATGGTTNEQAGPAPYTFTVTELHYNDSEGLCGTVDPYVKDLRIEGIDFGSTNSGTVDVPRDQSSVEVSLTIGDSDGFLCLDDDTLERISPLFVSTSISGFCETHFCYTATPIASPPICFDWNAQYVDGAPWEGVAPEDFLAGREVIHVPASFAKARVKFTNAARGVIHDWMGTLDEKGCVPAAKLPIREDWQLGTDLQIELTLISQTCLDLLGSECGGDTPPVGPPFIGANVVVQKTGQTGPDAFCTVFAENPGSVAPANCNIEPITWTDLPSEPLKPTFTDQDSVTRTAAVISHIFRREMESGLGVQQAMIQRRLSGGDGLVTVIVDEFCDVPDGCGHVLQSSCRRGNKLILQPDGALVSTARIKYGIAHEFGHFIQGTGQGIMAFDYGCGPGDPGQSPLCTCAHVAADDQLHCLQSMEESDAAQIEGFGQFFASKVFNRDLENDCTFAYYKPIADEICRAGSESCTTDPLTGNVINQAPVAVSCRQLVKWRNDHCIDQTAPDPLSLSQGTEWDWLEFLYGINNIADENIRWNVIEILDAYRAACGGGTTLDASCENLLVSWAGDPSTGHLSLRDGAQALAAAGLKSPEAADQFELSGRNFGVSNEP